MRAALLAALALTATTGTEPELARAASSGSVPHVAVVSSRADLVTGGDALVEVTVPAGATGVRVDDDGRDVTAAFTHSGTKLTGLVTGLDVGPNVLTARLPDGRGARLTVTNHPSGGPLFAGPQRTPWVCLTASDAQCSAPATHQLFYRSTNPARRGFTAYDPANPPTDVATTTTDDGRTVPFVVRVEKGVMNRGSYAIAVLRDEGAWTGKVLWPFGGDCKPWHKQDTAIDPLGGYPLDPDTGGAVNVGVDEALGAIFGNGNAAEALERGFLVATSSNNKLGSQCNTVVSAESIAMLKEHVAERYGPIRYTIGAGGSGGAMQQHQIASAYPGLLDGIQPVSSFPDLWSTVNEAEDCHLLQRYFNEVSPQLWAAPTQREAVLGTEASVGCATQFDGPHGLGTPVVGNYAGAWLDPDNEAGCGLPADQVYDPATNPGGARCTIPDYMVSVFGRRAKDGFANRPYDNAGVQYGLQALRAGRISAEQFVDLNEKVGGLDIDWNAQPARSVADPAALTAAYRGGLMTHGRELEGVPIVDVRGHDNYEIHANFHSYAMRARLDRDNGHHDNQVLWMGARPQFGDPDSFEAAFDLVDEWLERVETDRGTRTLAAKVRRNRPAAAVDTCWFEGRPVTDPATCAAAFPHHGDPRIAAGGPLADDVLKCRLRPLSRPDYGAALTDAQWERLKRAFPAGVCDYGRPGVGQTAPIKWPTFAGGPGGRPLGPAPESRAITP